MLPSIALSGIFVIQQKCIVTFYWYGMSSLTNIDKKPIRVLYKNYRGETAWRIILPQEIFFGNNEYHKETRY
jgi:hypothetical protein